MGAKDGGQRGEEGIGAEGEGVGFTQVCLRWLSGREQAYPPSSVWILLKKLIPLRRASLIVAGGGKSVSCLFVCSSCC